jgi:hypothetical protein
MPAWVKLPPTISSRTIRAAIARGRQCLFEQHAQPAVFEHVERRRRGAAGRGDAAAQVSDIGVTVVGHLRRAQRSLQYQPARIDRIKPDFGGSRLDRFDDQKEIGRPAAGCRGDRIHQRFVLDPQRLAGGLHDGLGRIALRLTDDGVGVQPRRTAADQRGRAGHRAHDGSALAERLCQHGGCDAGGDRHHQRPALRHCRGERFGRFREHLRLDGKHDDIRAFNGARIVILGVNAVIARQRTACLVVRLADANPLGGHAARDEPADQRARHVAATDKRDGSRIQGQWKTLD